METGNQEHTAQPAGSSVWGRGMTVSGSWSGLSIFQAAGLDSASSRQLRWCVSSRWLGWSWPLLGSLACQRSVFAYPWNVVCLNKLPSKMEGFNHRNCSRACRQSLSLPPIYPSKLVLQEISCLSNWIQPLSLRSSKTAQPVWVVGSSLATLRRTRDWGLCS